MIPAEFDYLAPDTLDDAIRLLSEGGEDAKLLAGGHSLLPLMKLRLATPSLLIDLRKVPGLDGLERQNGSWRIGAMTRHAELEHSPELGLLARAAGTIADPQVRNRGTIGGSLAHGDPASDLPAVLMIAEGAVTLRGPGGERTVDASELFHDYLETAVAPDEVLTTELIRRVFGVPPSRWRVADGDICSSLFRGVNWTVSAGQSGEEARDKGVRF